MSRCEVGSSSSNTLGSCVSARAMMTSCLSPPLNSVIGLSARCQQLVSSIHRLAIAMSLSFSSSNLPKCGFLPISTMSRVENSKFTFVSCGTAANFLEYSLSFIAITSLLSNIIVPIFGFKMRLIVRRSVVLPEPFGPMIPKNSPCAALKSTCSRTFTLP